MDILLLPDSPQVSLLPVRQRNSRITAKEVFNINPGKQQQSNLAQAMYSAIAVQRIDCFSR
jgi:hypothetical protein